jgi:hypothetical protein
MDRVIVFTMDPCGHWHNSASECDTCAKISALEAERDKYKMALQRIVDDVYLSGDSYYLIARNALDESA